MFILADRFLGFVFTNNWVLGVDRTVPRIWDLSRTGPKNIFTLIPFIDINISLKYRDNDIELLINVILQDF